MSRPEERGTPARPQPRVNAMLVCDLAIREEGTGKASLIGVFEQIWSRVFPCAHPRLSVFAMVSDAQGEYTVRLELVRLSDLMTVGRAEAVIPVENRLAPAEWIFELRDLIFVQPGQYEFRLWADDRIVGHKNFSVLELTQQSAR